MSRFRSLVVGLLAAVVASSAFAQTTAVPRFKRADGQISFGQGVQILGTDGNPADLALGIADAISANPDPTTVALEDTVPAPLPPMAAVNATQVVDMAGFSALSLNVSSMPAGSVLTFTSSEDGLTNLVPIGISPFGSPSGNGTLTQVSTTGGWTVPRRGRYTHITMTSYGGPGFLAAMYTLSHQAPPPTALIAHGPAAHSSTSTGFPLKNGGVVATTADTTLANGEASQDVHTTGGAKVTKPYAVPDLDWPSGTGSAVSITNSTTPVQITGAAGAGLRKYVTGCEISTDALGAANVVQLTDGSGGTVLASWRLQTTAMDVRSFPFTTPYKTSANTALFASTTGATTGGVYLTCRGYIAP